MRRFRSRESSTDDEVVGGFFRPVCRVCNDFREEIGKAVFLFPSSVRHGIENGGIIT